MQQAARYTLPVNYNRVSTTTESHFDVLVVGCPESPFLALPPPPQGAAVCTELTWLSVKDNAITSLAPLAPLQKLRVLNAGGNRIAKLDGVEALRELRALIVNDNMISDLSCVLPQCALSSVQPPRPC